MGVNPYLFISFSSRDIPHVREMMAAMDLQGIDFWDYSHDLQKIEVGNDIPKELKKEIDRCDKMVVIISNSSIDPDIGKYCRFEIEYARTKKFDKKNKFIPVILLPIELKNLSFPYDIFTDILHLDYKPSSPKGIVDFTQKICQRLDKTYIPPVEAHPNLPFWKFFRKEVEHMAHSNAEHISLMRVLGEFLEFFKTNDFEEALFLITYFIQSAKYKLPGYPLFYPQIVKALCETKLEKFDDAMKSFHEAGKVDPNNQDVIGGMGIVYYKLEEYSKAKECFQKIIKLFPYDHTNARINLLTTKMSLNEPVSDKEKEFLFHVNLEAYPEDLQLAVLKSRSRYLYMSGSFLELNNLCKQILKKEMYDTTTVIFYYISLHELGFEKDALCFLEKQINNPGEKVRLNRMELYSQLADYYTKAESFIRAINIFENHLLKNDETNRRHMIRFARLLIHTENFGKAKIVCEQILTDKPFNLPKSNEDFYYDGFANYLLGRYERAKYDYERSGNYDTYYSKL
ncbi:MAG: tetratricopeptide repeat protein [Bacteroidales bacterium]|nr:tetratricopeptide repeat protein [Bacteroidales bacterium]